MQIQTIINLFKLEFLDKSKSDKKHYLTYDKLILEQRRVIDRRTYEELVKDLKIDKLTLH